MQSVSPGKVFKRIVVAVIDLGLVLVVVFVSIGGFNRLKAEPDTASEYNQRGFMTQPRKPEVHNRDDQESLNELRDKIEEKQKVLQDIEKEKSVLERILAELRDKSEEKTALAEQLRKLETGNLALKEKIAETRRQLLEGRTIRVQSTPMVNLKTQRKPVYVALAKATIVPVVESYYVFKVNTVPDGNGGFTLVTEVRRNGNVGESVDRALVEGSDFYRFLEDVHTDKNFVALLVDTSSFETFRAVRQVLRQRGIPFGWLPWSSPSDFVLGSGHGVRIGEEVTG